MPNEPGFIYFDLGNVLLLFSHQQQCEQMARVAGVSVDAMWQLAVEGDLPQRYARGELSTREYYEQFCQQTGTRPDFDALVEAACDIFAINVPMLRVVTELRQQGYRLGVLSNTCDMHWRWVSGGRYRMLPAYFDAVALSFEVGALKPSPAIYRAAAEMAGVPPNQVFYTDDCAENIAGAEAAGFDAVHFADDRSLANQLRRRGVRLMA